VQQIATSNQQMILLSAVREFTLTEEGGSPGTHNAGILFNL
jgi:hypothetical protein